MVTNQSHAEPAAAARNARASRVRAPRRLLVIAGERLVSCLVQLDRHRQAETRQR